MTDVSFNVGLVSTYLSLKIANNFIFIHELIYSGILRGHPGSVKKSVKIDGNSTSEEVIPTSQPLVRTNGTDTDEVQPYRFLIRYNLSLYL